MAFHFITVRVLSIYETTIGMFYLPLSALLYWEIYSTLSLISSLAVLLWVCIASKLCILRQFCTFVFQEWRHCYLNIFLLIIFSCIIVCGKKMCLIMITQGIGRFVFESSWNPEGFLFLLSVCLQRDLMKLIITKWYQRADDRHDHTSS